MKSKFKFWPKFFLLICLFLWCTIIVYAFINFDVLFAHDAPIHFLSFPFIILNSAVISLIGNQLNHKTPKIIINDNTITKVPNFGLGFRKTYQINIIDGFLTYTTSDKNNANEYLYLIAGNERILKLSTYYYQNYRELKSSIIQYPVKNLGNEHWSIWKHLFS